MRQNLQLLAYSAKNKCMDKYDYQIINELQQNSRITNQELSEKVNLSPSPCLRRVRILEKEGIIAGYGLVIDQKKFGKQLSLFVRIKIERHNKNIVQEFEQGVCEYDEIISCHLTSGGYDYLLYIVIDDVAAYEVFLRDKLHNLPGISEIDSSMAFGCVKPPSALFV